MIAVDVHEPSTSGTGNYIVVMMVRLNGSFFHRYTVLSVYPRTDRQHTRSWATDVNTVIHGTAPSELSLSIRLK